MTAWGRYPPRGYRYFNPHEREARDIYGTLQNTLLNNFNPHEREARDERDGVSVHRISQYFNPHEREARDIRHKAKSVGHIILIHTSVKLVTVTKLYEAYNPGILIHTSVKLVTCEHWALNQYIEF